MEGARTCSLCRATLRGRYERCSACRAAYYCSREHAAAHWPAHEAACAKPAKASEPSPAPAEAQAPAPAPAQALAQTLLTPRGAVACALGDIAAQQAAVSAWAARPLDAVRAAAAGDRGGTGVGDAAAQYVLGEALYHGRRGLASDPELALAWWRRAAASGVALAQSALGTALYRGGGGGDEEGAESNFAAAARWFALGAAQGDAHAQHGLGCCLRDGLGAPLDAAGAARLFRLAAEAGHAGGQAALAYACMMGEDGGGGGGSSDGESGGGDGGGGGGGAANFAEALLWARRSAEQRYALGEMYMGVLYANGWGVERSLREAAAWFARAAAHGDEAAREALRRLAASAEEEGDSCGAAQVATAALYRLGEDAPLRAADAAAVAAGRCPIGDVAAQRAATLAWLARPLAEIRAAAEGGDLAAQYMLGDCLAAGLQGAAEDHVQARAWYRRAAAGNLARAQTQLGVMVEYGRGGAPADLAAAARLYAQAAAQGLREATFSLAVCFADGRGVEYDAAEAARLFRVAAEQGHAGAQARLASMLARGEGVARDFAASLAWARRAAEQGDVDGELLVGVAYHNGDGVTEDRRVAASWYARAALQGSEDAHCLLRALRAAGIAEATAALERMGLGNAS